MDVRSQHRPGELGRQPLDDMMRWVPDARCVGRTAYFFGPSGERPEARVRREANARLLCAACPAREQCRDWAREHQEYGFWGGESEAERVAVGV